MSTEQPQIYSSKDFSFLADYRNNIVQVSSWLATRYGLQGTFVSRAISASIIEEFHDRQMNMMSGDLYHRLVERGLTKGLRFQQ